MNHLQQSGSALPEEIEKLEEELKQLNQHHETHRDEAQKSHTYYSEVIARCAMEWNDITSLEEKETLTEDEKLKLDGLKCKFNLVISVDYQMFKLVPYWGYSAQPGSTYYLQKLSHDILELLIMLGNRLLQFICLMSTVDQKILTTPSISSIS